MLDDTKEQQESICVWIAEDSDPLVTLLPSSVPQAKWRRKKQRLKCELGIGSGCVGVGSGWRCAHEQAQELT